MKDSQLSNAYTSKELVKLENKNVQLHINLHGGAYFDFHLKNLPINPINFRSDNPLEPPFMGHFVCCDRWGPPSVGERRYGFTHHGEVNTQTWELLNSNKRKDVINECSMNCRLPMAGLQLTRKIKLSDVESVFLVKEEIKNLNKNGRIFNIVQHVSLAPPFLDRSTIFDSNAEKGFENKEDGSLNQENPILYWPYAEYKREKVSLRHFEIGWPRVASFVYNQNDKFAWVTACNPKKNLMLGYIWKTVEYPWVNFWRSMRDGMPVAFGMEFGTTGLHEPFPVLAKKGKIFGRNIYDFIDAGEIIDKSFIAFLAKIPEDYLGVENVQIEDSQLFIKEKNITSREIIYDLNNSII